MRGAARFLIAALTLRVCVERTVSPRELLSGGDRGQGAVVPVHRRSPPRRARLLVCATLIFGLGPHAPALKASSWRLVGSYQVKFRNVWDLVASRGSARHVVGDFRPLCAWPQRHV